ncbi:MAG: hypothetical protein WDO68_27135 [Gammaproteobacteria bacterium]
MTRSTLALFAALALATTTASAATDWVTDSSQSSARFRERV